MIPTVCSWFKHILFHNMRTALRLYQLPLLERVDTARYSLSVVRYRSFQIN